MGMEPGSIGWHDLTVPDAEGVREFYGSVIGWTSTPVDMGDYSDFCMNRPGDGETVAGVCHARGVNADLPPVWLVYFIVEDLDGSLEACTAAGGEILRPAAALGADRVAIIRDPAGAVSALYEKGEA